MLVAGMLVIAAALFAVILVAWALRIAVSLVIGVGYLVYGAVIAAGWVLFAAGWLVWQGCRVVDWAVGKCAPPVAARRHRRRGRRAVTAPVAAERRPPPVKEIGVVHWGYGQLNPARTTVRQVPAARTRSLAARR